MLNPSVPQFVLIRFQRVYDFLPSLIGLDWSAIQPQIDAHLTALKAEPNAFRQSAALVGLLARYESARLRLDQEFTMQEMVSANLKDILNDADESVTAVVMADMAWDVDTKTVLTSEDHDRTNRAITMKGGGMADGRSVKFQNLDLDLGKMLTGGTGFLLTGLDILDKFNPFIVAGGILVMVSTLLSEMTVKTEPQEEFVFWVSSRRPRIVPKIAKRAPIPSSP